MNVQLQQAGDQLRPIMNPARMAGFYRVTEAAAIFKYDPRTLWRWIRAGKIPAYGTRNCVRISLADIPVYVPKVKK